MKKMLGSVSILMVASQLFGMASYCDVAKIEEAPLNMINVTSIIPGAQQETIDDIIRMYNNKEINSTLLMFTLVPEGNPVSDKAKILCENYKMFLEQLKAAKVPTGVLIQATIGHGWTPQSVADYQKFVYADGSSQYMFCPLDKEFQEYIRGQVKQLAELNSDFVMLDDDFRMYTGRTGCFCPLHLAKYNELNNTNFSREELWKKIQQDSTEARRYDEFLKDSLVNLAKIMRAEFDKVNPNIPGSFCTTAGDVNHASAVAEAMAGKGNTPTVRINNARYLNDSPRSWTHTMYKTMMQISALPENFNILAETDTFPHNRYSTSATTIHTLYSWSLLAGCNGGKLWITPLKVAEFPSGKAYRNMLHENANFYREINKLKPEWEGIIVPLPVETPNYFPHNLHGIYNITWGSDVFGRMGIPFHFSKKTEGKRVALTGEQLGLFSDAEIKKFLSGKVLLDGAAAVELTKRGFGEYLGVNASDWKDNAPAFELGANGIKNGRTNASQKLIPNSQNTEILSTLYGAPFSLSPDAKAISAGATKFKNSLGGDVIITAGSVLRYDYSAFAMLNESRKKMFVDWLDLDFYYPGDAEIYTGLFKDNGKLYMCVVNMGLDELSELDLVAKKQKIDYVEQLQSNGKWEKVPFKNQAIKSLIKPMKFELFRFSFTE